MADNQEGRDMAHHKATIAIVSSLLLLKQKAISEYESMGIVYTNNSMVEKGLVSTVLFKIVKRVKYHGINLTKDMEDLNDLQNNEKEKKK